MHHCEYNLDQVWRLRRTGRVGGVEEEDETWEEDEEDYEEEDYDWEDTGGGE